MGCRLDGFVLTFNTRNLEMGEHPRGEPISECVASVRFREARDPQRAEPHRPAPQQPS